MIAFIRSAFRKIVAANGRAGFGIIRGLGRVLRKVSPGLSRRYGAIIARGIRSGNLKYVNQAMVPGLTAALAGGGFALYHYLREDRETLIREGKYMGEGAPVEYNSTLESISISTTMSEKLRSAINKANGTTTDIEAFVALMQANNFYLDMLESVSDPKVLEYATRHLLELTCLRRQGLTYEHASPNLEGNNLYVSYENDPTPQGEAEFLIAMEAVVRANTRLTSDTYGT